MDTELPSADRGTSGMGPESPKSCATAEVFRRSRAAILGYRAVRARTASGTRRSVLIVGLSAPLDSELVRVE